MKVKKTLSFDSLGGVQWSSMFPSNQATFSVQRVPREFLLLLVNLDTKTKDEFHRTPNSDVSLSFTEKLHQMHSGNMFREELRGKACKGRASVLHSYVWLPRESLPDPAALQGAPSCGGLVVLPSPPVYCCCLGPAAQARRAPRAWLSFSGSGHKAVEKRRQVAIKVEAGKAKYICRTQILNFPT